MSQAKIKCPNCGFDFNADEVLYHQAEERAKKQYEEKLSEQILSLNKKKEDVDKEMLKIKKLREEQDDIIRKKLEDERKKLSEEALFKAKKDVEFEMLKLKQDNEMRMKENNQLKKKEVDILNKERELRDKQDQLEIDLEKKILEREKEIQVKAIRREQEKNQLKNREYEKQLEEQKKIISDFDRKEFEMINKERELKEKAEQLRLEMEKQLNDRANEIEEKARHREKERAGEYEKILFEQKQTIDAMKRNEIEFLNMQREMKDKEEQMKLDLEKQMLDKETEIREKAVRFEQEKNELKNREFEKQLDDQKKLIDELKRKAEQGSQQMQGEIQELALEEFLRGNFPFDRISEVKKGERGADAIHIVINNLQQECGKIIYESKRTQAFSEKWIEKLKEDQKNNNAEIAVIVTEAMPKDMERFGLRNGIWICGFAEIKGLAFVLREMLLMTHSVKSVQENKGDKMEMLYNYLTSSEFRQQVEAIVEGFTSMHNDLLKEKVAMEKIWSTREKQIRKVLMNTSSMYGSIKGLAGNSLENIKALEMPEGED